MSHKENKSHEEKASGFKKNDLILVLLVFVAAGIFLQDISITSQKSDRRCRKYRLTGKW